MQSPQNIKLIITGRAKSEGRKQFRIVAFGLGKTVFWNSIRNPQSAIHNWKVDFGMRIEYYEHSTELFPATCGEVLEWPNRAAC
jgi:hypothetical protein